MLTAREMSSLGIISGLSIRSIRARRTLLVQVPDVLISSNAGSPFSTGIFCADCMQFIMTNMLTSVRISGRYFNYLGMTVPSYYANQASRRLPIIVLEEAKHDTN